MGKELGPPVEIDRFRGAPNRIYRIGIELEGGWNKLPPGVKALQHDGSVHVDDPSGAPCQVGELAHGPMTMEEWEGWLKKAYPQHINHTCGMHVHMTPKSSFVYSRLLDPRYPGTVIAEFKKWAVKEGFPQKDHHFWQRLKGKSVYCQHLYMGEEQIRNTSKDHNRERDGHRYTVINYAYGRYGTVECRLLPMMANVDQAKRAVQELIDITNAFLRASRKKEPKAVVSVQAEESGINDELVLEIPANPVIRRVQRFV